MTNKSLQRVTSLRVMKVQKGHVMVTCREVVVGLLRTGHLSQDPKDEGVGKVGQVCQGPEALRSLASSLWNRLVAEVVAAL